MDTRSEVARLREQIRLEYEAAYLALHGPAIVATHEIINRHMENMQKAHTTLQTIVGIDEAIKIVAETIEEVQ
jgi:hypothetical protein